MPKIKQKIGYQDLEPILDVVCYGDSSKHHEQFSGINTERGVMQQLNNENTQKDTFDLGKRIRKKLMRVLKKNPLTNNGQKDQLKQELYDELRAHQNEVNNRDGALNSRLTAMWKQGLEEGFRLFDEKYAFIEKDSKKNTSTSSDSNEQAGMLTEHEIRNLFRNIYQILLFITTDSELLKQAKNPVIDVEEEISFNNWYVIKSFFKAYNHTLTTVLKKQVASSNDLIHSIQNTLASNLAELERWIEQCDNIDPAILGWLNTMKQTVANEARSMGNHVKYLHTSEKPVSRNVMQQVLPNTFNLLANPENTTTSRGTIKDLEKLQSMLMLKGMAASTKFSEDQLHELGKEITMHNHGGIVNKSGEYYIRATDVKDLLLFLIEQEQETGEILDKVSTQLVNNIRTLVLEHYATIAATHAPAHNNETVFAGGETVKRLHSDIYKQRWLRQLDAIIQPLVRGYLASRDLSEDANFEQSVYEQLTSNASQLLQSVVQAILSSQAVKDGKLFEAGLLQKHYKSIEITPEALAILQSTASAISMDMIFAAALRGKHSEFDTPLFKTELSIIESEVKRVFGSKNVTHIAKTYDQVQKQDIVSTCLQTIVKKCNDQCHAGIAFRTTQGQIANILFAELRKYPVASSELTNQEKDLITTFFSHVRPRSGTYKSEIEKFREMVKSNLGIERSKSGARKMVAAYIDETTDSTEVVKHTVTEAATTTKHPSTIVIDEVVKSSTESSDEASSTEIISSEITEVTEPLTPEHTTVISSEGATTLEDETLTIRQNRLSAFETLEDNITSHIENIDLMEDKINVLVHELPAQSKFQLQQQLLIDLNGKFKKLNNARKAMELVLSGSSYIAEQLEAELPEGTATITEFLNEIEVVLQKLEVLHSKIDNELEHPLQQTGNKIEDYFDHIDTEKHALRKINNIGKLMNMGNAPVFSQFIEEQITFYSNGVEKREKVNALIEELLARMDAINRIKIADSEIELLKLFVTKFKESRSTPNTRKKQSKVEVQPNHQNQFVLMQIIGAEPKGLNGRQTLYTTKGRTRLQIKSLYTAIVANEDFELQWNTLLNNEKLVTRMDSQDQRGKKPNKQTMEKVKTPFIAWRTSSNRIAMLCTKTGYNMLANLHDDRKITAEQTAAIHVDRISRTITGHLKYIAGKTKQQLDDLLQDFVDFVDEARKVSTTETAVRWEQVGKGITRAKQNNISIELVVEDVNTKMRKLLK